MLTYGRFKKKFVAKVNEILSVQKLYAKAYVDTEKLQPEDKMVDILHIWTRDSFDEIEITREYFFDSRRMDIPLEQLYLRYVTDDNLDEIAKELVRKAELKIVPTRIFYVLTDDSEEKLDRNHIPHRPFMDNLNIVYHIKGTKDDGDNVFSRLMKDKDAENLNLTEKDLFELASKNTDKQFPPITRSYQDAWMLRYMTEGYSSPEAACKAYKKCKKSRPMFACSSYNSPYGITLLLNKQYLLELAERLGGDYYVLFDGTDAFAAMGRDDYKKTGGAGLENCLIVNGNIGKTLWMSWRIFLYSERDKRLWVMPCKKNRPVTEAWESDFCEPNGKPPLFETP